MPPAGNRKLSQLNGLSLRDRRSFRPPANAREDGLTTSSGEEEPRSPRSGGQSGVRRRKHTKSKPRPIRCSDQFKSQDIVKSLFYMISNNIGASE